jgi:hypothetical protein
LAGTALTKGGSVVLPSAPPANTRTVLRSMAGATEMEYYAAPWLGWVGLIAMNPDGDWVALAYAGARELLVVSADQGTVRRLALPAGLPRVRLGEYCDSLRFAAANRVVMTTVAEEVTWILSQGKALAQTDRQGSR